MNIKTLAIAAAAVMTAGAAQAADLGKPVKAAVDYVKVCDAYGAGFFYIPGSDTCLQISGYARSSWEAGSSGRLGYTDGTHATSVYMTGFNPARTGNAIKSATEVELDFDARTNTDFGLLRSYISMEWDFNSGGPSTTKLNRGYIQWGGLTAGRTETFFTHYTGDADGLEFGEMAPDYQPNVLAYTFTFGNGVTATLSIEDPTTGSRNQGNNNAVAGSFVYGGAKTPDVVAQLAVTQAWGSAQLSAGLHEDYGTTKSKEGYGILGYIGFNLPMIGAGDKIDLQVAWSKGVMAWADSNWSWNASNAFLVDMGRDAVIQPDGTLKQTEAWSIGAGFVHNFSATVFAELEGGVEGVTGWTSGDFSKGNSYTRYNAAFTLGWKPVKGLTITGDVEYTGVDWTGATKNYWNGGTPAAQATNYGLKNGDAWIVGVRVLRNF